MVGGKAPCMEFLKRGLMKRPQRYCPGTVAICKIHWYQMSTELLIHKCSFSHLVHEIAQDCGRYDLCFQVHTFLALQEAAEFSLTGLLEDVSLCTIYMKCITIMPKDIQLAHHMHGEHLHY